MFLFSSLLLFSYFLVHLLLVVFALAPLYLRTLLYKSYFIIIIIIIITQIQLA